jgi:hypothetical protein
LDPTVVAALDQRGHVVLSSLPGVDVAPNLALPPPPQQAQQQPPQQAQPQQEQPQPVQQQQQEQPQPVQQQQEDGGAPAAGDAVGSQPVLLPSERQAFRWRLVAESAVLPRRAVKALEDQIARWRALVGPVAGTTIYMLGGTG